MRMLARLYGNEFADRVQVVQPRVFFDNVSKVGVMT
jgi:hypothetical protein